MSDIKKIAYNTISQSIGKILVVVISLLLLGFLTRYLGPHLYGFYILVTTYLALATSFCDLGVSSIGVREIAKYPTKAPRILSNVFSLRFIFALTTFVGVILISFLTYQGNEFIILRNAILIASFTIIINNLTSSWITIFLAKLKMAYVASSEVVNKLMVLIGVLIAIKYNLGFLVIVGVLVFGNLVQLILVSLFAKYLFRLKLFLTRSYWRSLFRDAWPLGLFLLISALLFRIDVIFISYLRGPEEVGLYGVSFKVLEVLLSFAAFFGVSIFPIIAYRLKIKDQQGVARAIRRSTEFILLLSLPLVISVFFLSQGIISIIAGNDFFAAIPALKILSIAIAFGFFNALFGYLMVAQNKQKTALWITSVGLFANVILNLIFIPIYGFVAAAATTLLAQSLAFILNGYFISRFYHIETNFKNIIQIIASALLLGLFLLLFSGLESSVLRFIITSIGVILYFSVLIVWNKEFKETFLKLIKKERIDEKR